MTNEVKPYNDLLSGKKSQVKVMFNNIAHEYDFLNHFLSLGIDKWWRKRAIKILRERAPAIILDVATGTGDFALEALKLNPEKIIGIDLSEEMLKIGKEKIVSRNVENVIELRQGDAEKLEFEDNSFDAVTVAFGVRNFENLNMGLKEIKRVLREGGQAIILEFSKPKTFLVKWIYNFYIFGILPIFGRFISKDKAAYTYLPKSVMAFPEREKFVEEMKKAGFEYAQFIPLTMGVVCIYVGREI